MKRNILIHTHIFKNAGSSFDSALEQHFKNGFVDHRDDKALVDEKENYLIDYLNKNIDIQAFSSHSIHFLLKNNEKYHFYPVYFLRHPIERIKSVYSFEKKQTPITTIGSQKAKLLSFNDYVKWYTEDSSPATIRNAQTIFLSGEGPVPKNLNKAYKIAKNTIDNFDNLIGIVDRYDESIVVFEEKLKNIFPEIDLSYIRKNITDHDNISGVEEKVEKLLSKFDKKTQSHIKECNQFDLDLYIKADKLLDTKISEIDNFNLKLQIFQDRCIVKNLENLLNQEKYEEMIHLSLPRIDIHTKNPHIYLNCAMAYRSVNNYVEAIRVLENGINILPQNPWLYFAKAEMTYASGDHNRAQNLFNQYCNDFSNEENIISIYSQKLNLKESIKY